MRKLLIGLGVFIASAAFVMPASAKVPTGTTATSKVSSRAIAQQSYEKETKIITYVGAYVGPGNFNANIGINSAVFKTWLPDYKKYAFDIEIGHATDSTSNPYNSSAYSGINNSITTTTDTAANYLLLNTHYELDINKRFKPYLIAGFGYQSASTDISVKGTTSAPAYNYKDSNSINGAVATSGLIYQIGIGCTYPVAETVSLDARVRYATVGLGGLSPQIGVRVAL